MYKTRGSVFSFLRGRKQSQINSRRKFDGIFFLEEKINISQKIWITKNAAEWKKMLFGNKRQKTFIDNFLICLKKWKKERSLATTKNWLNPFLFLLLIAAKMFQTLVNYTQSLVALWLLFYLTFIYQLLPPNKLEYVFVRLFVSFALSVLIKFHQLT